MLLSRVSAVVRRFGVGHARAIHMTAEEIAEGKALLSPVLTHLTEVVVESASGPWVTSTDQKKYVFPPSIFKIFYLFIVFFFLMKIDIWIFLVELE